MVRADDLQRHRRRPPIRQYLLQFTGRDQGQHADRRPLHQPQSGAAALQIRLAAADRYPAAHGHRARHAGRVQIFPVHIAPALRRKEIDRVMPRQIVRRARPAVPVQIGFRGGVDLLHVADAAGDQAGIAQRAATHGHVDALADQIGEAVVGAQLDLDVGYSAKNSCSAGITTRCASRSGNSARTTPPGLRPSTMNSALMSSRSPSRRWQRSRYSAPSTVRLTLRVVRCNSRTPSCNSMLCTALVTVGLGRPSCSAACVKLLQSATARKICMALSWSIITFTRINLYKNQYLLP